jgi:hypothetical protein
VPRRSAPGSSRRGKAIAKRVPAAARGGSVSLIAVTVNPDPREFNPTRCPIKRSRKQGCASGRRLVHRAGCIVAAVG